MSGDECCIPCWQSSVCPFRRPSQMIFQYDPLIDEELQIFTLNSLFCRNFSLLALQKFLNF